MSKINESLIKRQELRINEVREKMMKLNDEARGDFNGIRLGIKELHTNFKKVAEDAAKNKEDMTSISKEIRK
jgi:hypothetical protein